MKNRSITLVVLTVLAIFAGGIQQTQAQNHWTNAGASPGGGFIIIGNSASNLGPLGPSTSPVHLSATGFNVITVDAGSTASTTSGYTIDLEQHGNMLSNYGSLLSTGTDIYVNSSGNTLLNYGKVNATTWGFYINQNNNILSNWGTISASSDSAVYVASQFNTINNYRGGMISGPNVGVWLNANGNIVNNWGTISSTDEAVDASSDHNTIYNWGTISATGFYGIIAYSNNTIYNWGAISASGAGTIGVYLFDPGNTLYNYSNGTISGGNYGVSSDDDNNLVYNWGVISASPGGSAAVNVTSSYSGNVISNWGMINANGATYAIDIQHSGNTLNLYGHSSVIGKIKLVSNNTVNLNFTGVNAAYLNNVLKPSLLAQGVNSGNNVSVKFMLRGVTYNIDPAMVYEHITSYQLQGVTPNQAAIGASLDSATVNPAPGSPLFNLFNTIDASGNVPAALEAFSPQQYEAFGDLAIANASAWVLEIDERLNNIRNGSESIDTSGIGGDTVAALVTGNSKDEGGKEMKESKAVETTPVPNRWGFFASGNGLFFRGNPHDADFQDAKANTVGTLAGVDAKVGDHAVAGVLFAYENSPVDLGNGGNATIESYAGGLYGGWHDDGFYVNGLAAYTRNNYTSTRSIVFPGFAAASNGSTNGNQATANIDGGYDWNVTDRFAVGPIAGLQYVHLDINGFDEAGAGAAGLTIGDQDMDSLQSRLGLHAEYRLLTTAVSSFAAEAHAAWQHEYLNDSRAITASFEGSGLTPFAVQTASPQRDAAVVGADVNYTVHNRLTLFAGYDLQIWNSSYFEQTVNAGARITW